MRSEKGSACIRDQLTDTFLNAVHLLAQLEWAAWDGTEFIGQSRNAVYPSDTQTETLLNLSSKLWHLQYAATVHDIGNCLSKRDQKETKPSRYRLGCDILEY